MKRRATPSRVTSADRVSRIGRTIWRQRGRLAPTDQDERAAVEQGDEADEARLELGSPGCAWSVPRFGLNMQHHLRGARASQLIPGVRRTRDRALGPRRGG